MVMFFLASALYSQIKYKGDFTTGLYSGTPFWSQDNLEDRIVDPHSDFYRIYNRISFTGEIDNFSLQVNALRNDNFFLDGLQMYFRNDHVDNTKLYQVYAKYKFGGGDIRAGRFLPFNRWYFGSVDGGMLNYRFNSKLSFNGFGGLDVKYGNVYYDENRKTIAYGELAYKDGRYGGNAKVMYSNDAYKGGLDFFGSAGLLRFSGNFGYDFTNSRLFDGSLGLYAYLSPKFNLSANYTRFTPISFFTYEFYSEYIDRINLSATYKLFNLFSLSFRQMVTMSSQNLDYLSYLYLSHKFFYVGVNYLGGDSNSDRFGISVGGRYSPVDNLRLMLGIASVDFMFDNRFAENRQTYASYFKVNYDVFDFATLSAYVNYYDNNSYLYQKWRGGATLQLRFKGGDK